MEPLNVDALFVKLLRLFLPQEEKRATDNASDLYVIGAGLQRTGTSSLKAALEILGFGPCHHGTTVLESTTRAEEITRMYDGANDDFRKFFKGYGSVCDIPAPEFYREIHREFPHAKIILTVRDSDEAWYTSVNNTLETLFKDQFLFFSTYLIPSFRWQIYMARKAFGRRIQLYGTLGPSMHSKHNARVIEEYKDRELLVYNVKEGWAPLCKFLGVGIPEGVPFPRVNDTNTMQRAFLVGKAFGLCVWIFLAALVILVLRIIF